MKKQCEKDCKTGKMTVSIINHTDLVSTTDSKYEGGLQKYQETKKEDKFSGEKFLELSVRELRAMLQSGIARRSEEGDLVIFHAVPAPW